MDWTPKDHMEHQKALEEMERRQKQAKPKPVKRKKTKKKAAK